MLSVVQLFRFSLIISLFLRKRAKMAAAAETNLIINYLPQSLTDQQFHQLFEAIGPMVSAKVMRNKTNGYSFGYGFVNYQTPEDAAKAIDKLNGMPLEHKRIKVAYSRRTEGGTDEIKNANVFIANLPKTVDEEMLRSMFSPYGEIIKSKILMDHASGVSKGCGFILYAKTQEADNAIAELHGTKAPGSMNLITVKKAQDNEQNKAMKQGQGVQIIHHYSPYPSPGLGTGSPYTLPIRSTQRGAHRYNPIPGRPGQMDSESGHTLFIYNIGPDATEIELYGLFGPFGAITKVHIQRDLTSGLGKGFGFVTYADYNDAVNAIQSMNGYEFEKNGYKPLQVSFKTNKTKT